MRLSSDERQPRAVRAPPPWPAPFDRTTHRLHLGDARNLGWIPDESVHLVVTSPPYWTLKEYEHTAEQLGDVEDYENFLAELDKVWTECARVLAPGGRICCAEGSSFRVVLRGRRFGIAASPLSCRRFMIQTMTWLDFRKSALFPRKAGSCSKSVRTASGVPALQP